MLFTLSLFNTDDSRLDYGAQVLCPFRTLSRYVRYNTDTAGTFAYFCCISHSFIVASGPLKDKGLSTEHTTKNTWQHKTDKHHVDRG
jgi:hypothetical protein